ncbi:hypothetical protein B7494_g6544 [Chlorociboria aeruginascens]|nr:hypothetical protein B7494_g6544 [Chlorociboria aeruginascens]
MLPATLGMDSDSSSQSFYTAGSACHPSTTSDQQALPDSNALTLYSDILTSGASHPKCQDKCALIPPPAHLEVIISFLVHPYTTTRVPQNERVDIASRTIIYLRSLLTIAGPLNSKLGEACVFEGGNARSRKLRKGRAEGYEGSGSDDSQEVLGIVAETCLRISGTDFWHAVGWAFNCSVAHPKRWKYWKIWLEFMLDVLDADWRERQKQDENDEDFNSRLSQDPEAECKYESLRNSLLVKYLSDSVGRSNAIKRVVKSAFADGSPETGRAYPEVFENETVEPRPQKGQKRKRDVKLASLNGNGHFDDDDDDTEDDDGVDASQSMVGSSTLSQDNEGDTLENTLGGPESIILRQRLLTLLSRVTAILPDTSTGVKDLYEIFWDCIKSLPLPLFSHFVSPSRSNPLPTVALVSLVQLAATRLLSTSAHRPQQENDDLSQDILETCYLPFSANTSSVEDNAKLSVLVEMIFRLLLQSCPLYHTPNLEEAVEKGIAAREFKVRKKRDEETEQDRAWLKGSSQRLRGLLACVEMQNEKRS